MTRFTLHIDAAVPLQDVIDALAARGIHVREDEARRLVANRVPRFLARAVDGSAEAEAMLRAAADLHKEPNVVRMGARVRKVK